MSKRSTSTRRGGSDRASEGDNSRVRVVVRIRPLNSRERAAGHKHILQGSDHHITVWDPTCFETASRPEFAVLDPACWSREFAFDRCLWSHDVAIANYASQSTVYDEIGQPVLDWILNGYNCCVFAFGQTGAGKSFTMMGDIQNGDPSSYGLVPRICFSLFDAIDEIAADGLETSVVFSHMEIYNEYVRDLMAPRSPGPRGQDTYLKVREHPSRGVFVSDLTTIKVTNFDDVMSLVAIGDKNRTVGATNSNAHSSRSHAIVTLTVVQRSRNTPKNGLPTSALQQKIGRVHLVDLAGSERVTFSGAQGKRLKEANHINRSLSVLGDVIKCLGDSNGGSKRTHIPYRNSTLTMVLKDSLGGNAHAVMLTAVSPSSYDYEETISTLKYADRAKRVHMRVEANVTSGLLATDSSAVELVPLLQAEVRKLREMLAAQQLKQNPNTDPGYYRSDVVEEMRERVKELETQLAEREMLIESLALMRQEQLERVMFNPANRSGGGGGDTTTSSATVDGINELLMPPSSRDYRDRDVDPIRRSSVASSQNSVRWADEQMVMQEEGESNTTAPALRQQVTPERLRQRKNRDLAALRDLDTDTDDDTNYGGEETEEDVPLRASTDSPRNNNEDEDYARYVQQPRSPSADQLRKSLTASLSLSENGFGSLLYNDHRGRDGAGAAAGSSGGRGDGSTAADGGGGLRSSRDGPLKVISTRISGELSMGGNNSSSTGADYSFGGGVGGVGGGSGAVDGHQQRPGGGGGGYGGSGSSGSGSGGSPQRNLPVVVLSEDAVDVSLPRVINLNQDPLFSECLVYYIPEGDVCAGSLENESDILLSGPDICAKHCTITHDRNDSVRLLAAESALIFVNGDILPSTGTGRVLQHFDRIAFGRFHLFRFEAGGRGGVSARPSRGNRAAKRLGDISRSSTEEAGSTGGGGGGGKTAAGQPPGWEFAQEELLSKNDALMGLRTSNNARPATVGDTVTVAAATAASAVAAVATSASALLLATPPQTDRRGSSGGRLPGGVVPFDTYKDMISGSGRKSSISSSSPSNVPPDTGSTSSAASLSGSVVAAGGAAHNHIHRRSPSGTSTSSTTSNGKLQRQELPPENESSAAFVLLPPMPPTLPMSISYAKHDMTISPTHHRSSSPRGIGGGGKTGTLPGAPGVVISAAQAEAAQIEEDERLADEYWSHLTRVAEGREVVRSTKEGAAERYRYDTNTVTTNTAAARFQENNNNNNGKDKEKDRRFDGKVAVTDEQFTAEGREDPYYNQQQQKLSSSSTSSNISDQRPRDDADRATYTHQQRNQSNYSHSTEASVPQDNISSGEQQAANRGREDNGRDSGRDSSSNNGSISGRDSGRDNGSGSGRDSSSNNGSISAKQPQQSTKSTDIIGNSSSFSSFAPSTSLRDRINNVVQQVESRPRSWGPPPSSSSASREKVERSLPRASNPVQTSSSFTAATAPAISGTLTSSGRSTGSGSAAAEQRQQRYATNADLSFDSTIDSSSASALEAAGGDHRRQPLAASAQSSLSELNSKENTSNTTTTSVSGNKVESDKKNADHGGVRVVNNGSSSSSSKGLLLSTTSSSGKVSSAAMRNGVAVAPAAEPPAAIVPAAVAPESFAKEALALQEELAQMQRTLQDRMQRYQILTAGQQPSTSSSSGKNNAPNASTNVNIAGASSSSGRNSGRSSRS